LLRAGVRRSGYGKIGGWRTGEPVRALIIAYILGNRPYPILAF
jgi:hypothetical protein